MTDTIDMAREAGLHLATDVNWMPVIGLDHLKAFEALVRADERKNMQAEKQEPVACAVCTEVHAILDADESKIIRDAKDGYPDGRTPRTLTLQERITALCVYASDWKRWCLEKENTNPPAQEFVCSTGLCHFTLTQTNVGIGERGMQAYEEAKKRGWVGLSDKRLMEMPKQEPVAWCVLEPWLSGKFEAQDCFSDVALDANVGWVPLYTTPQPQREWVGLTDEEIVLVCVECAASAHRHDDINYARAIEAKLKEKNT